MRSDCIQRNQGVHLGVHSVRWKKYPKMPLTALAAKNFQPQAKAYKKADEGGLFLLVNPNGSKYWRLKYRFDGKEGAVRCCALPNLMRREILRRAQPVCCGGLNQPSFPVVHPNPRRQKAQPCELGFLLNSVGSPTWARTRDLRINSPSLYRLSYQGTERRIILRFSEHVKPLSLFFAPLDDLPLSAD